MAAYQDLIDWCNKTQIPNNRQTAVSVSLYQAPAPGQPAEAAWVGTLTPATPTVPQTFELAGSLRPLDEKYGEVLLHIVVDAAHQHASATIQGHKIKPPWHTTAPCSSSTSSRTTRTATASSPERSRSSRARVDRLDALPDHPRPDVHVPPTHALILVRSGHSGCRPSHGRR
jgi:hypothetical protein